MPKFRYSLPFVLSVAVASLTCGLGGSASSASECELRTQLQGRLHTLQTQAPTVPGTLEQAKLLYRLAEMSTDAAERRALLAQGSQLTRGLRDNVPANPEAILLWTALEGSVAEMDKNLGALAAIREIESALLRLRQIDSSYGHAAADRALGTLYLKAPPLISVGSARKANLHLRAAAARFPDDPENQLALAELLLSQGEKEEAKTRARQALANHRTGTPFGFAGAENSAAWEAHARRVLAHAGG